MTHSNQKKLEEKLREILQALAVANVGREHPTLVSEYIAQIKQAFADEGYVQAYYPIAHDDNGHKTYEGYDGEKLMTGQEWYEKCKKELAPYKLNQNITMLELDQTLRRASGLEGDV